LQQINVVKIAASIKINCFEKYQKTLLLVGKTCVRGCPQKMSATSGEGVCLVQTFCDQWSFSDVDVCSFWCKNFGFFRIYGVFVWAKREGVESV